MTSVAVISSAAARIECLKKLQKQSESLPSEIDYLLKDLQTIKGLLVVAAYDWKTEAAGDEFVKLEKQVVRLSYEIVDAIADGPFKPKEMFAISMLIHRRKSGIRKLEELKEELNDLLGELRKIINLESTAVPEQKPKPESTTGSEMGGEKTAGTEQKPKPESSAGSEMGGEKTAGPEQKPEEKSDATRSLERKRSTPFQSKPKEKTPAGPEQKTGSEIHAGLEQKPESTEIQEEDADLLPRIRDDLLNPSADSSEVYMVGEGGMGKSSLARRLFHDPEVRKKFDVFGWVSINQNFHIKGVLQLILQQLGQPDTREMNEIQLIAQIFDQLKNKKYLIVLDDIRSKDDWESIRLALPLAKSSAVIITTSSDDFNQEARCYKIPGLSQLQILSLLKKNAAFRTADSEEVGKAISDISGGSPLYATILGKSLQKVATGGSEQELVRELHSYKPQKGTPQVLEASYKRLAPELKPCLLYMGQFPPCQDIEFDKLYLLLMAENLLSTKESKITPQTFKDYLAKLASLKFVGVQEDIVSTTGLYKSCRLHDRVREFCNSKGLDEEFFEVLESESSKKVGAHTRRLAIHMSKSNADNSIQFDSSDTAKKILSLLIFDTFDESAGEKSEIHDLIEFSHLRILNFDGVNFKARRFPKGVDKLVLLRYLSFRGCWLEELPSSMSHLTQLETLDLLVQADCKMLIPNSILTNMKKMVHLYLPRLYHSKGKSSKLQLQGMEEIETLVNFDTEICNVAALSHLKKLTILSTICMGHFKNLDVVIDFLNVGLQHSSVVIKSFDCYNSDGVSALKKLLKCKFVHSIHVEGQIVELPKQDSYAEKVVEIVLDGSQLEHDPMSYLGKFQNLRSLVLSNDAFLGDEIVISSAQPFRNLRSLKLEKLQYLEKIRIEKGAMPELSTLQIDRCDCLLELSIPKKLFDRLKQKNGGDAQWAMALPSKDKINITP